MQFSPIYYSRLKSRLHRRYVSRYQKVLKQLKAFPKTKTSQWMHKHQSEFLDFSPQRWFFIEQVTTLLFFLHDPADTSDADEFTPEDDAIFERWNKSEFADVFLKLLNKRLSLREASKKSAHLLDEHLVALGNLHLLKAAAPAKNYRLQTSLGDIKKKNTVSRMLETTLHLNGKELVLLTNSMKEMKLFSSRIEGALRIIQLHSPDSWERFTAFTEVIVPISQKEFVSYSHQELPGTSMINLYHREFVDLLDDLLHENGHHHLNYYLNLETLISEPIDCIYYSPWRRTLRPLRGIYHAFFTFFWAFKFFSDLAQAGDLENSWHDFSEEEKEKIIWRSVEEFWMLEYTFHDLQWAYKQGLINDMGWNLIKEQRAGLKKFSKKIPLWEKSLRHHKQELKELKKTLQTARKKYTRV